MAWRTRSRAWHITWIALALAGSAVVFGYLVGERVFEHIPHLEDEIAYWWQAQIQARGFLKIPSPPEPQSFLVPFVVDHQGYRFAKYPPGWPMLLALAIRMGFPFLLNPLLTGLGLWILYRLGCRYWNARVALLAVALACTSPWLWLLSGSLLPHIASWVYTGAAFLFWQGLVDDRQPRALYWWGFVFSFAALFWTRPWTAVGVALPFVVLALVRYRNRILTIRDLLGWTLAGLGVLVTFLLWQAYLTGYPLQNPYTLWWAYDRIGFGPGHGPSPEGHSLHQAWINTRFSLGVGAADLFGWFRVSWLFMPFGVLDLLRREGEAWALVSVGPALVLVYCAYWVGAWLFGPRYYFEGFYGYVLLTAAGMAWLTRFLDAWLLGRLRWRKVSPGRLLVGTAAGVLVVLNLWGYLPQRLAMMHRLYGISRAAWRPFLDPENQKWTPAVVIVESERWMPYGALLPLEDPWLTTPWIFAWSRGEGPDRRVLGCFPERHGLLYNPTTGEWKPYPLPPWPCPDPLFPKPTTGQAPRRHPETSP